jgi:ER-bound oxygenase mpaB/B'/Rubber oxygenase, catalytic domain
VTGLRYDARDPDLLLWVHACLVDSFLLFERLTVGRLDNAGRQAFHGESMVSAELLRLPKERIPPTVPALRAYLDEVMASGILRMTDGARRVADLFGDHPGTCPAAPVAAAGQPARPPPRPPPGPTPDPLRRPRRHGRLAPGGPLRIPGRSRRPLARRLTDRLFCAHDHSGIVAAAAAPPPVDGCRPSRERAGLGP